MAGVNQNFSSRKQGRDVQYISSVEMLIFLLLFLLKLCSCLKGQHPFQLAKKQHLLQMISHKPPKGKLWIQCLQFLPSWLFNFFLQAGHRASSVRDSGGYALLNTVTSKRLDSRTFAPWCSWSLKCFWTEQQCDYHNHRELEVETLPADLFH